MKHKILGTAALLLIGPVASALAGSVYVPLATDHTVEGVRYRTQIWATNSDATLRQFTSYFIPTESDGTDRPENWGASTAVEAGATMLLAGVAGSGEAGMLEISGAPHIVVSARLVPTVDGVTGLGAAMPVVGSSNLFAAGATAHLQGWIRSGELVSDFGVVNLGAAGASCTIDVFRSDGTQIQGTAVIAVPPLGHRQFDDALQILGEQAIAAVRSAMSCDQPFYVYLRTYDRTTGELFFTLPSLKLADSTLEPPGAEPPPPEGCSIGAAYCFQQAGVVFVPTRREPVGFIDIPVPNGTYRRVRATLSFRHGGWYGPAPYAKHNVFWLVGEGGHFDLLGYVNLQGPNRNRMVWTHGIGRRADQKARLGTGAHLTPGQLYHLFYDYDAAGGVIHLRLTDAQGNEVFDISDEPNVSSVRVVQGRPYMVAFGNYEGHNPNEVPSFGWEHRDLVVEFFD